MEGYQLGLDGSATRLSKMRSEHFHDGASDAPSAPKDPTPWLPHPKTGNIQLPLVLTPREIYDSMELGDQFGDITSRRLMQSKYQESTVRPRNLPQSLRDHLVSGGDVPSLTVGFKSGLVLNGHHRLAVGLAHAPDTPIAVEDIRTRDDTRSMSRELEMDRAGYDFSQEETHPFTGLPEESASLSRKNQKKG